MSRWWWCDVLNIWLTICFIGLQMALLNIWAGDRSCLTSSRTGVEWQERADMEDCTPAVHKHVQFTCCAYMQIYGAESQGWPARLRMLQSTWRRAVKIHESTLPVQIEWLRSGDVMCKQKTLSFFLFFTQLQETYNTNAITGLIPSPSLSPMMNINSSQNKQFSIYKKRGKFIW